MMNGGDHGGWDILMNRNLPSQYLQCIGNRPCLAAFLSSSLHAPCLSHVGAWDTGVLPKTPLATAVALYKAEGGGGFVEGRASR